MRERYFGRDVEIYRKFLEMNFWSVDRCLRVKSVLYVFMLFFHIIVITIVIYIYLILYISFFIRDILALLALFVCADAKISARFFQFRKLCRDY